MTLPAYSRSREGEGRELGCDVSNGSHTARSRPVPETSESMERAGEGRFRPRGSSLRLPWAETFHDKRREGYTCLRREELKKEPL